MEFGNVGFSGGRKTGVPGEKSSEQGREPTTEKLNLLIRRQHQESTLRHPTLDDGAMPLGCKGAITYSGIPSSDFYDILPSGDVWRIRTTDLSGPSQTREIVIDDYFQSPTISVHNE